MTITKSESYLKDLFLALSQAQPKIKSPEKNVELEDNIMVAPLIDFFDNVSRQFSKVGLFFFQNTSSKIDDGVFYAGASTLIGHQSGGWIEGDFYWQPAEEGEEGLALHIAKKTSFCAAAGITSKAEDKVGAEKTRGVSFFKTPEERRLAKQAMIDDLQKVRNQAALDEFSRVHKKNLDVMTVEDEDYTSDVRRQIKILQDDFDRKKDNLKGKI